MAKSPFSSFPKHLPPMPQMPKVALDRFGNLLEPGHLILFHAGEDLIFEVTDVHPVLNPGVQGGQAIRVTIIAKFPVEFPASVPNRTMVIVGESQARMAARAAGNGQLAAVPPVEPSNPPAEPSGIVLTDGDPSSEPPMGPCDACGDLGEVNCKCVNCGGGTHQKA